MSIVFRTALGLAFLVVGGLPARAQDAVTPWPNTVSIEEAYFPEDHDEPPAFIPLKQSLTDKFVLLKHALTGKFALLKQSLTNKFDINPQIILQKGVFERASSWSVKSTLVVCFLNGSDATVTKVAGIGQEWNFTDTPLRLDFGNPVRRCGAGTSDIKVRIVNTASWAPVGARNRSGVMRLGVVPPGGLSDDRFRQIVLHEFGHALGLWHELKHASGQCWNEFKHDRLRDFYKTNFGVSKEDVIRSAIGTFDPVVMGRDFQTTAYDRNSVMMYAFPAELYRDGAKSPCWAPLRHKVSDGDMQTLKIAMQNRLLAASRIAAAATGLDYDDRELATAYNALLLAGDTDQQRLLEAADRVSAQGGAKAVAAAILKEAEHISIESFGQH